MNYSVILAAAGSSNRFGKDKLWYRLKDGRTVLKTTLDTFLDDDNCKEIVLVASKELMEKYQQVYPFYGKVIITWGGDSRSESVYNGLLACSSDYVLIHDAARPWIDLEDIDLVLKKLKDEKAVILTAKVNDTIKVIEDDKIIDTINRDQLRRALTPQGFDSKTIRACYKEILDKGIVVTDDAQAYQLITGNKVSYVDALNYNEKITTLEDVVGR